MIGRLRGTVAECRPGRLLLEVGGVGYTVQISLSTFYALSAEPGVEATLHVHTHVREDALQLFGFATLEERAAFELLIGISGVGPRLALAILSGIGVDELGQAVAQQDRARLQSIPGVGKKTAERVLLELRDKMPREAPARISGQEAVAAGAGPDGEIHEDAVSALVNLGFAKEKASRAVERALEQMGEETGLERLLRASLGRLVR
jgi:Holliday junction DNA helicase RuvA